MRFQTPLVQARLIRRYKRFLADMELADGRVVTAHCANPGAMLGMADTGMPCWVEPVAGPGRKLEWSWRLVDLGRGLAVVDTGVANKVVAEGLAAGLPGLVYQGFRAEVAMGAHSRVDFVLDHGNGRSTALEVKSVTLARGGWAEFPDSRTARGARHLQELTALAEAGKGAAMLYLVARSDVARVRVAADIDPAYARAFDRAVAAGVRMLGFSTQITPEGVGMGDPVEVQTERRNI